MEEVTLKPIPTGVSQQRLNQMRFPERHRARLAVKRAVSSGALPRPDTQQCALCGQPATEYHHRNGCDKPHRLDVTPLCRDCHNKQPRDGDERWHLGPYVPDIERKCGRPPRRIGSVCKRGHTLTAETAYCIDGRYWECAICRAEDYRKAGEGKVTRRNRSKFSGLLAQKEARR